MAEFAKKWQAMISLALMLIMATLAWGKLNARVDSVEIIIRQEKLAKQEIVSELRKIREEIVRLRIAQATTNQELKDHIQFDR